MFIFVSSDMIYTQPCFSIDCLISYMDVNERISELREIDSPASMPGASVPIVIFVPCI